jgi:hypothetical protein
MATLWRTLFGPAPEIICSNAIWNAGVAELRERTLGASRESGAFLLGHKSNRRTIKEFVYYDDIDPHALETGIVIVDGRKLGALWEHCRKTGREVVADIHVHPGGFEQSLSDRANPVIAEIGHFAMILPHYARRATRPGGIGLFQYLGARQWKNRSREAFPLLHVGWWPL